MVCDNFTCLKHLLKAEDGILGGAIWSKMPPVALKSGMTRKNTVAETSPKHKTSAFFTLKKEKTRGKPANNFASLSGPSMAMNIKKNNYCREAKKIYPSVNSQEARIRPALINKRV